MSAVAVPLRRRSRLALGVASLVGLIAFCWPVVAAYLAPGGAAGAAPDGTEAPLVLALVLVMVLVVLAVSLADGGLDVKAVSVLGLLAAVGTVLRPVSAGTAGVELVFLVVVLGGRVFGPGFGFALGATTLLGSALVTGGVGPWLPYQMLAAAWMGAGAGLLPRVRGRAEVAVVAVYGAVAALVYGLAINLPFWPMQLGVGTGLSFDAADGVGTNLRRYLLYVSVTSLGWDVGRAVTMVVGLVLLGGPVMHTLRRAARRAAFAPVTNPAPAPVDPFVPGSSRSVPFGAQGGRQGDTPRPADTP